MRERLKYLSFWVLAFFVGLHIGQPEETPSGKHALEFYNCQEFEAIGSICKPVRYNGFSRKTWCQISVAKDQRVWQSTPGKVVLYIPNEDSTPLRKHQVIHFKGKMTTLYSNYPSYLSYLNKQGLSHQVYVDQVEIIGDEKGIGPLAYQIQQKKVSNIDSLFQDSIYAGLIKAMMLGEKKDLDREVRRNFATAGISHVLAISGMHVGIIFLILDKIFFFMAYVRGGYQIKQFLIFLCLITFMFVSGASPAVVRATLMFSGILLAKITYQRYQSLNIVSLTGILQLFFQPHLIHDLGFQLSYSAVLALIVLYPKWEALLHTDTWWRDALLGWIGVTLIATLATTPIIWNAFGTFPTYFLLTNVLVSLPITLIVWVGFLCVLFSFVPIVNTVLASVASLLINGLLWTIETISGLPHAVLQIGEDFWAGIQVLIIELILGAIMVLSISNWRNVIPGSDLENR